MINRLRAVATVAAGTLLAALALTALVPSPALAAVLDFGVRAGVSSEPDQLLGGGHIRIAGLIPSLPALWIEPNATIGVGDSVTVIQLSGDVKYALPVNAQLIAFPLVGLTWAHYTINNDFCDLPGADCSGSELGLQLGGGVLYGRFGVDLVLGLSDELPDVRLMGSYSF